MAEKFPDIVRNRSPDAPGGDDNGNRLEQARGTVTELKLELVDATSKRDTIQKELASVPATLTVDQGLQIINIGGQLSPIEQRLQELRRNLDTLLLKYTDEHPDVKAARQAIAQLQSEATKTPDGGAGQGNAANKGQIANGVYDQIKVRLVDAEAVVNAVQRRLTAAETQVTKIEQIAQSAQTARAAVCRLAIVPVSFSAVVSARSKRVPDGRVGVSFATSICVPVNAVAVLLLTVKTFS